MPTGCAGVGEAVLREPDLPGGRPPPSTVSSAGPPRSKASTADQGRLKSARICARSAISGTQTTAFPSRVAHAFMVPSGVAM